MSSQEVTIEFKGRTLEVHYQPLFEPAEVTYPGSVDDYSIYIEQIIWVDGENRHDIFWAIDYESDVFTAIHDAALKTALEIAEEMADF